jgi:hypothetical protein
VIVSPDTSGATLGGIIGLVIVLFVIFAIVGARSKGGSYDQLMAKGIPARGILIQVDKIGTRAPNTRGRPFELRGCTIDVEIPGQEPYQVIGQPLIPLFLSRDVLPGATVELRVHPTDKTKIAIVGPGVGFNIRSAS